MKKMIILLGGIMTLVSCSKLDVHSPNAQIEVNVDDDKYSVPLNHIVRPDTGSYPSFDTDMGNAYFFWPSGRGLNNQDKDPNVLEHDDDIISFYWTARNSGVMGNDMPTRVAIRKESAVRNPKQDSFDLEAYIEKFDKHTVWYIGSVYPSSPTTIECFIASSNHQNSICQMEYVHPDYNNYIQLQFSRKNLADWKEINRMAINYMEKWYDE
ncbi:hypothetical protein [Psychrobacter phenylpyruvicus]|uniref:Uncharacterized protein n=1 Tax=Psychrobacter phenylpyruvicus TaxID=29432 RepID=A0A379LK28_9GAMM|nr:hypothetical protein [Psychrobacter phenylpyruvicus]SUD90237.1 Uncharacterised protein [Psychrobacter phenylpyruvicus]